MCRDRRASRSRCLRRSPASRTPRRRPTTPSSSPAHRSPAAAVSTCGPPRGRPAACRCRRQRRGTGRTGSVASSARLRRCSSSCTAKADCTEGATLYSSYYAPFRRNVQIFRSGFENSFLSRGSSASLLSKKKSK
uniref:Predicted protein n=1 Tax=Hordeum vulgare subsp. vulgare TaxID=112509 RepID=F2EKH4_HORVV|nr:predicted protein [Hordeum vulgare subsp. vulgare]